MRPAIETKWVRCRTPAGELVFAARPELRERHKSIVVLIHDVMGSAGALASWFGHLEPEAELVLGALPGHGKGPPLAARGWNELVGAYDLALRSFADGRRVLVAGAGLGGVIALALGARGYACVALDPFLSTAKQWPIAVGLGRSAERGAAPHPDLLFDALGWREGGFVEDRRYGDLLGRIKAPALVVCGDVLLGDERELQAAPSMLDEADHALLAAYPDVRVQVVSGCGHNILAQAPGLCRDLILEELARA